MQRPLLAPLLALIAGILAGDMFQAQTLPVVIALACLCCLLGLCLATRRTMGAYLFLCLIIFCVGFLWIQKGYRQADTPGHIAKRFVGEQTTLEGVVKKSDRLQDGRAILIVQTSRVYRDGSYTPATGLIRLTVLSDTHFGYGGYIRFVCTIRNIRSFANPGGYDFKRKMQRLGIFVSGSITQPASIVLIRQNASGRLPFWVEKYRHKIQSLITRHSPSPQREIIQAITLGNSRAIPQEIREAFAKTGTSHVLAISGLHVGMVAACGFFIFFWLLKFSEYLTLRFNIIYLASFVAVIFVIAYAVMASMNTTVTRAALMAVAGLAALVIGRQKDPFNILFAAGLVILMIRPESLFDVSFQLSFSAVFTLLYLVPMFNRLPYDWPENIPIWGQKLSYRFYQFMLVSLVATLGTLPLIAYYFNLVSFVTLLANVAAVPLLGFFTLIPSLLCVTIAPFSDQAAGFLISVASFFAGLAIDVIIYLADKPWSSSMVSRPSIPEIILFYTVIFLGAFMLYESINRKHAWSSPRLILSCISLMIVLVVTIICAAYPSYQQKTSGKLIITALDVGQGSSTLVQFPHGFTMLIDGGGNYDGSFDPGRLVIAPFLYHQKIKKVDVLVLTHPHPDHLGGLIHVARHFHVKQAWVTGQTSDDDLYKRWESVLIEKAIDVRLFSGQSPSLTIQGVTVDFLWPPALSEWSSSKRLSHDELNDTSLVFKLTFGKHTFLVTGDIGAKVESVLAKSGRDLAADVLFVPHHGSISSSTEAFIQDVGCRFAVISAGQDNLFRHPHPTVVKRYQEAGVIFFRTDQDGAIQMMSDGESLQLVSFAPK